ncbi:MAG: putative quinol monooxygenase [Rhodospirillales bacterium]|jgi:quinol monooxygenase YgiN|nr:putative quinol monooxygenase [Rhodospirillales bacterium]
MFVVAAEFRIKPDRIEDFKKLIDWQAERSIAEENGCVQFDVCQREDDPGAFLLYEVYTDAAAFDEGHMSVPRFEAFMGRAKPMMEGDPAIIRLNRLYANAK